MVGENNAEVQALLKNESIDTAKIAEQVSKKSGIVPDNKKPEDIKPDPIKPDPIKPDDKKIVPDPETIRTGILNEMFGDQFKSVEEVKKANILEALKERDSLRQKVTELSDSLAKKPKHAFASDDIAKFNEFARETGIKDASVFNRINVVDLANMTDMDALILQHTIDNPRLATKDPQEVRNYFEMKYNVDSSKIDPKRVESGDMTQEELDRNKREYNFNKMELEADADKARVKLQELKSKIKMPENVPDEPGNKKWTPEIEAKQKETWGKVNTEMFGQFSTLPIRLKGAKEPIVNFVLPEEAKSTILANAIDYAVSNQMEVNQENVESIAKGMYSDIRDVYFDDILHAVFERARTLTEKEILEVYHNPSGKNNDNPPAGDKPLTAEEKAKKAADAEINRYR